MVDAMKAVMGFGAPDALYLLAVALLYQRLGRVEKTIEKKLDNGLTSKISKLGTKTEVLETKVLALEKEVAG